MTDDTESCWPSKETALADLRDRELQASIRRHYKYNDGVADATERFNKATAIAAELGDATRGWRKRRA